jgi:hypothetical protein
VRRITKIGAALAGAGVVVGMTAVPASAATGSWKPINSYTNIGASGTYSRSSTKVTIRGTLSDYRRDGYTACVRFLFTEPGATGLYWTAKIMATSNGRRYHYDGRATVNIAVSSSRTGHLYVQECGRKLSTGKYYYGRSKRIY